MDQLVTNSRSNLRKAAVLLRSLDSETAAVMLGQLSREEAGSLRAAVRELGAIDPEEQADVMAEFRSARPAIARRSARGVELEISQATIHNSDTIANEAAPRGTAKRFEFLANAPTSAVVPYLAREHAQTIAVVLSHL